jgi:hypothetical protein
MRRREHRSGEEIAGVIRMHAEGLTAVEIARRSGISVFSIRNWLGGRVPRSAVRALDGTGSCSACGAATHDFTALSSEVYTYLLGMYLGDGFVTRQGTSYSLRITLDSAYPGIVEEAVAAVEAIRGRLPLVQRGPGGKRCVIVVSYWKQWPCFFPQHGPGRKHNRPIVLEPWQQAHVDAAPERFLRALIHTDGWRGFNKVHVKGKDYEYPRYQFSNRSDDIRKLFTDTCDKLGIEWRPWGRWHVSVARRDAVARMDEFIGEKR